MAYVIMMNEERNIQEEVDSQRSFSALPFQMLSPCHSHHLAGEHPSAVARMLLNKALPRVH